ncbi:hypothetical protein [Streptomyces monomycini]|uniref:hypothetical protein n=1 Tax=Streptomyces monomycini TaxID=371720 RepID=UPI0004ABC047|nr:hypothetical protein [Streptomyces monomycini]
MPIIGPGYDDPAYDGYDPAWRSQVTPFRQWLYEKLTTAHFPHAADTGCGDTYAHSPWCPFTCFLWPQFASPPDA